MCYKGDEVLIMNNDNLEDAKKIKREKKKKELRKQLSKIIVESEKMLYKGKKIIIVVIITALEVLANLLTLMDEDNRDDENDWR